MDPGSSGGHEIVRDAVCGVQLGRSDAQRNGLCQTENFHGAERGSLCRFGVHMGPHCELWVPRRAVAAHRSLFCTLDGRTRLHPTSFNPDIQKTAFFNGLLAC